MCPRPLLLALAILAVLLAADTFGIGATPRIDSTPIRLAALTIHDESRSSAKDVVLEETFSVEAGDRLAIAVAHTDVTIRRGSGSEVGVRIEASGTRGRAFFEYLNFEVEKRGDAVHIATNPRDRWNRRGGDVDVSVTVPESFDAEVDVAHGDLEVERMNGELSFTIAHGDFSAGSLSGSSLRLHAEHGDVDVSDATSGKIQIEAAHGDVDIERLTAVEFETSVQHGDIEIDRAEGYARVSSAHGNVEIGFLKVNGGALTSEHGDIDIAAPVGVAIDVDFAADNVEIDSGHTFQGTVKNKRAEGRINGGGPRLDVKASHGEISLGKL